MPDTHHLLHTCFLDAMAEFEEGHPNPGENTGTCRNSGQGFVGAIIGKSSKWGVRPSHGESREGG